MARLLADENLPFPVVAELRRLGHDVQTLQDLGVAGRSLADDAVLDLASTASRAVVTLNRRHFIRLHESRPAHAGIVICTFDADFTGHAARVHAEILRVGDLTGRLTRVHRPPQ